MEAAATAEKPDEREVAEVIAKFCGLPVVKVQPSSRLWHDLGIAGDDFVELIDKLHRRWGVTLAGQVDDYCPSEGDTWRDFWWWPFKRDAIYRGLTVSELARSARDKVIVG